MPKHVKHLDVLTCGLFLHALLLAMENYGCMPSSLHCVKLKKIAKNNALNDFELWHLGPSQFDAAMVKRHRITRVAPGAGACMLWSPSMCLVRSCAT